MLMYTYIYLFLYVLGMQNCLQISTLWNQVWTWVEGQSCSFGSWLQESTFVVVGTLRNNTASWDKWACKDFFWKMFLTCWQWEKAHQFAPCLHVNSCELQQPCSNVCDTTVYSVLSLIKEMILFKILSTMRHYLKSAHSGY